MNAIQTKGVLPFILMVAIAFTSFAADSTGVRFSEVMSSNGSTVEDADGDSSDWMELVNEGSEPVALEGWGLSDKASEPFRWTFPSMEIGPGEFVLVWASGKNRQDADGKWHANFSLSADGEILSLTAPGGESVDVLPATVIPRDISFGRLSGGETNEVFFDMPTPGWANVATGFMGIVSPPAFTVEPGFYSSRVELDVRHDDPDVVLRYTVDGRFPDAESPRWNGPIPLDELSVAMGELSMIPTTVPEVDEMGIGWLPPLDARLKAHVVRVVAFKDGYLSAQAASGTWFVGAAFSECHGVDVVSLILDPDDLFDEDRGIYVPGVIYQVNGFGTNPFGIPNANYYQLGLDWERPAHFEYYDSSTHRLETDGNLGVRIHGNASRILPQKSLRLYQIGGESAGGLRYPFFTERNGSRAYESLMLRNSGQDWFANGPTMLRDACLQRMVRQMNFEYQANCPTVVYINGEYWGIHQAMEYISTSYLASQFGLDAEQIDLLEAREVIESEGAQSYAELLQFMREQDVSQEEVFREVQTQMDVDSYIDYIVAETFLANSDWPGNNVDFWRWRTDYKPLSPPGRDGRWRWILSDLDFAALPGTADRDMIEWLLEPTLNWPRPAWSIELINHLWKNKQFVERFCRRYADHLNTTFRSGSSIALLEEMATEIEGDIVAHFRRWGRDISLEQWREHIRTFNQFMQERPAHARAHLIRHFPLGHSCELTLNQGVPERGVVQVNGMALDGARTPGLSGRPATWTGEYFAGMRIVLTAVAEAGYRFSHWEGVDSDAPRLELELAGPYTLGAVFEAAPSPEWIHYWSFNSSATNPVFTVGGGRISVSNGPTTQVVLGTGQGFSGANAQMGEGAGSHLRVNHPLGAALDFKIPTVGFENVVVRFEARRSGQGAGLQTVAYTTDGETYRVMAAQELKDGDPVLYEVDFSAHPEVAQNADVGIRLVWEAGGGGDAGNVRLDNFSVEGTRTTRARQEESHPQALGTSPWDAGYTELGAGWRRLAWFGDYVPMGAEGWIWHHQHGFQYVAAGAAPMDLWVYADDMGWQWTSRVTYPFLYRAQDGAWLWYNGGTSPRWFMNMKTGQWESWP